MPNKIFLKIINKSKSYLFSLIILTACVLKLSYLLIESFDRESYIVKNLASKSRFTVESMFYENNSFLKYLGENISLYDKKDFDEKVSNYLLIASELSLKSLTTSYVSWSDKDGNLTISGKAGIQKHTKKNIRRRNYFSKFKEKPWKILFSKPEKSVYSSKYVLPTAMSITDKNGDVIGALILGLRVDEINERLNSTVNSKGYKIEVYDSENNAYMPHFNSDNKTLDKKKNQNAYVKKMKDFPYEIHVSIDPIMIFYEKLSQEFTNIMLILFTFLMGLFFIERISKEKESFSQKAAFYKKRNALSELSLKNRGIRPEPWCKNLDMNREGESY